MGAEKVDLNPFAVEDFGARNSFRFNTRLLDNSGKLSFESPVPRWTRRDLSGRTGATQRGVPEMAGGKNLQRRHHQPRLRLWGTPKAFGVALCPDTMHQAMTSSAAEVELSSPLALCEDAKKNR
jgi:hypothetical protein